MLGEHATYLIFALEHAEYCVCGGPILPNNPNIIRVMLERRLRRDLTGQKLDL